MPLARSLAKTYDPKTVEPRLNACWQREGIYQFDRASERPVYAIDTPPATVSGHLHLGHAYSYSHPDFIARFWRMNGYNIFYPMGFDDNGLPTERLVEKRLGITAQQVGRQAFIEHCLDIGRESEEEYRALWQRLGLSIDWHFSYRSINTLSRRTSQQSFLDLYRKGLAYQQEAPTLWCPECQTAIAQAELDDLERQTTLYTLVFTLPDGTTLPIATTRPELLPACVAVFAHPDDARYAALIGSDLRIPLTNQTVPMLADPLASPEKGTGAVMCCTFGDATDIEWWRVHQLPLRAIMDRDGCLTDAAGAWAGLTTHEARARIIEELRAAHLLLTEETQSQSVRVHERCNTPVEYLVTRQWFIRVLDHKEALLKAGEQLRWHPAHMGARYRAWVENLKWDWCISRQRYFGVPFPVWYCTVCGATILANDADLPIDPTTSQPTQTCVCGGSNFTPERDVMDTWATSSMSPQIVGQWLTDPELYQQVFPFVLRPQAHEIIRTWTFYTIVKSLYMFGTLPWREVAISGWGLASAGTAKISKSRGGGPISPNAIIEKYSADAVRYWAAGAGFGKDAIISEERIQAGAKLAIKLWNVARFTERVLADYPPAQTPPELAPADRWLLARLAQLVERVTTLFTDYDYATAKAEVETFFWTALADNYLELAKMRLYDPADPLAEGARYTLRIALLTTIKLFAPFLPYVTEEIYTTLFADEGSSIHRAAWPTATDLPATDAADNTQAEAFGDALVTIATAVRRYKSEHGLSLGAELARLQLATDDPTLADWLRASATDLRSVTRAATIAVTDQLDPTLCRLPTEGSVHIAM
ncbi:MAG TPA: valine--tRNA ligase [Ktedonobacterales bacterium]|nr:valine--tRNA ligase [Ktedonobacterales bacterium]